MLKYVQVTDGVGAPMLLEEDRGEPEIGSIILVNGEQGTAWQRMFVDGKWHSTRGGTPRSWKQLTRRRNVLLVHEAPERVSDGFL